MAERIGFHVRCTRAERDIFHAIAAADGLDLSGWVRYKLNQRGEELRRIRESRRHILSEEMQALEVAELKGSA